jgi:WS/DGAT/MGAT family acyltransferase
MRQLTSLDAQFLALEDGRTHGHVAALGVYDPSTAPAGRLTLDAIRELVAGRLHLLPPFRWRLVEVPLGLDHPYWLDDPGFDLDFHLRELALPAPGDQRMLAEQVARIVARPLDRARPLWELYLIHGLEDGRVAVLTKMHHAAVDGMSGAEVLSVLLDPSPEGRDLPAAPPARVPAAAPGALAMLARGLAGVPRQRLRSLRGLPRTLPHLDQVPTLRTLPGVSAVAQVSRRASRLRSRTGGGVPEGRRLRAPRTSVNAMIGPHRHVALTSQSLAEVKRIKGRFGVTVNDVVIAICAGALRTWLADRGELPEDPLLAMVPVSVRTEAQRGTFGNRVATMMAPIPTDVADPVERLAAAHEAMRSAKERHKVVPAGVLQDANEVIPPALFARAARVTTAVTARHPVQAPVNAVISNVPGSPVPLYLAGAELEALFPVSAIMHGVGLNITVMSHRDALSYGVVADRDLVDDAWPLADALDRAQAELLELVDQACIRGSCAASPYKGGQVLPGAGHVGTPRPPCARRFSSPTGADDRLPAAAPGRVERRDGIVERRDVVDVRPQPSVAHALHDLGELGPVGLDDEVDRQAVGRPRLDRTHDGHQHASGADQGGGPLLDVTADDVEDQIDAADVLQRLTIQVDELPCAVVERALTVGRAPGADHVGAELARELRHDRPDGAGRAVREDALPRLEAAVLEQPLPRGQARDGQARAHGEVDVPRERREVARLHGHVLGQGPVAMPVREPEDALADGQPGRAVSERADHAGHLVARDRRRPVAAGAIGPGRRPRGLGRDESRRVDLHDHVVDRRLRLRPVHQGHPGRPRLLVRHHDRLHPDASFDRLQFVAPNSSARIARGS